MFGENCHFLHNFLKNGPTSEAYNSKTVRPTALKNRKTDSRESSQLSNGASRESLRRLVPEILRF